MPAQYFPIPQQINPGVALGQGIGQFGEGLKYLGELKRERVKTEKEEQLKKIVLAYKVVDALPEEARGEAWGQLAKAYKEAGLGELPAFPDVKNLYETRFKRKIAEARAIAAAQREGPISRGMAAFAEAAGTGAGKAVSSWLPTRAEPQRPEDVELKKAQAELARAGAERARRPETTENIMQDAYDREAGKLKAQAEAEGFTKVEQAELKMYETPLIQLRLMQGMGGGAGINPKFDAGVQQAEIAYQAAKANIRAARKGGGVGGDSGGGPKAAAELSTEELLRIAGGGQ